MLLDRTRLLKFFFRFDFARANEIVQMRLPNTITIFEFDRFEFARLDVAAHGERTDSQNLGNLVGGQKLAFRRHAIPRFAVLHLATFYTIRGGLSISYATLDTQDDLTQKLSHRFADFLAWLGRDIEPMNSLIVQTKPGVLMMHKSPRVTFEDAHCLVE